MIEWSLQVTYRKGKPFAAYLRLPRATAEQVSSSNRLPWSIFVALPDPDAPSRGEFPKRV